MNQETFSPNQLGYIRQWLVAGPHETPYQGPPGEENVLRKEALDPKRAEPPKQATIGATGPFGKTWGFHYPGENFFVELTKFYHCLTLVDSYAFTELTVEQDVTLPALFWVAGAADLWVNGVHLTRFDPIRYMYPDAQPVELPLKRGTNTLCVRLQCLGVRDTRILFGLQLKQPFELVRIHLPGDEKATAPVIAAANWLDGVRTEGRDRIISAEPAPSAVEIAMTGKASITWPAGKSEVGFDNGGPFQITVSVSISGQTLKRQLEIPANWTLPALPSAASDFRREQLEEIAKPLPAGTILPQSFGGMPSLTARRLLGQKDASDAASFANSIGCIDRREDCADFALSMLLRFHLRGLASPEESAEIKRAALAFRYWSDEPGNDAMCFWSENHSLLFHGCQRIAGLTFPDEKFSNTGKTGSEQAAIAIERCRQWLDHVEPRGFDEFLSGAYMPITILALLNLVDFAGDEEVSRRAAGLIDRIYRDLAAHAFRGVTVGPQGRVYRDVLYPEKSGTQSLLAYASREALPCARPNDWVVFLSTSPTYLPPQDLVDLMQHPISKRSRQADVEIVLHKTVDYLLTSLAIPATFLNDKGEPGGLQPGWGGYQQHVWQATLAPGCHVFVNHPGCSFDLSASRPGYWYGNGLLPRVDQREGQLCAVYSIPDGSTPYPRRSTAQWFWPIGGACPVPFDLHPVPFTHAHWPSDAFDEQQVRDHWAFGRRNDGYIALWCSEKLQPHHDTLTGRELRAWGHRCGWMTICGSAKDHGSFASFIDSCLARNFVFDAEALTVTSNGGPAIPEA